MRPVLQVQPGRLRHRLELEERLSTPNDSGGEIVSWQSVATVWAAMEPLAAEHREQAQRESQIWTHKVRIRSGINVQRGWRFVKDVRKFVVKTVRDPDETGRYVECLTEEDET